MLIFESIVSKKMATATTIEVLQVRKNDEGLTQQEVADDKRLFNKFDKDKGGSNDADELGKLVRVLGLVFQYTDTTMLLKPTKLEG